MKRNTPHRVASTCLLFALAFAPVQLGAQSKEKEKDPKAVSTPEPAAVDPAKAPGGGQGAQALTPSAPVDPKTFKIGSEDVLMIRVWREPDVSGMVQVRPDGRITIPLAGEIVATGRTPEQLAGDVTEALSKFLNKPEVSVAVQSVQSRRYYITGEARRTGQFPLVVPTTVMQALSAAGGLGEYAKRKKIIIMRGTERIKFNYDDIIKGKNLDQNILLENDDHIFVP